MKNLAFRDKPQGNVWFSGFGSDVPFPTRCRPSGLCLYNPSHSHRLVLGPEWQDLGEPASPEECALLIQPSFQGEKSHNFRKIF